MHSCMNLLRFVIAPVAHKVRTAKTTIKIITAKSLSAIAISPVVCLSSVLPAAIKKARKILREAIIRFNLNP